MINKKRLFPWQQLEHGVVATCNPTPEQIAKNPAEYAEWTVLGLLQDRPGLYLKEGRWPDGRDFQIWLVYA
jgi:hypothetical protein